MELHKARSPSLARGLLRAMSRSVAPPQLLMPYDCDDGEIQQRGTTSRVHAVRGGLAVGRRNGKLVLFFRSYPSSLYTILTADFFLLNASFGGLTIHLDHLGIFRVYAISP